MHYRHWARWFHKEEITSTLNNLFQKIEKVRKLPTHFIKPAKHSHQKMIKYNKKENYKLIPLMNTVAKIIKKNQQIKSNAILKG